MTAHCLSSRKDYCTIKKYRGKLHHIGTTADTWAQNFHVHQCLKMCSEEHET